MNDISNKPAILDTRWDHSGNFIKIQCPRCEEAYWFRSTIKTWNCMRCKYRYSMFDIKSYPVAKEISIDHEALKRKDFPSDIALDTTPEPDCRITPGDPLLSQRMEQDTSKPKQEHDRRESKQKSKPTHKPIREKRAMSSPEYEKEKENRTLAKAITKSAFIHIQDAFSIGKVIIWIGQYSSGEGCSKQVKAFLDIDAARVIFGDLIIRGGFPEQLYPDRKMEFYGGTTRDNEITARVLKFSEDPTMRSPIIIEVASGPGKRNQTGGYQPIGKLDSVKIFLDRFAARKLAATVIHHLQWLRPTLAEEER